MLENSDFHYRDAMRLLYILTGLAEPYTGDSLTRKPSHVFVGEKRLMALDFYMRYPDYLANEILNLYEDNQDESLLALAKKMMEGDEPDVRTILMVRWKRGAYQRVETALSILEAPGLIKTVQDTSKPGKPWAYLLFPLAFDVAKDAIIQQPSLDWYPRQVSALKNIHYEKSGTELKKGQYSVREYDEANLGSIIPSIKNQVYKRLESYNEYAK
ncbi:MAG: hypothetical protein HRT88_01200 [Lentisphaeraceae bacterium]|nr:hypothetical protein [Lentisphaeraceae bacterium]